MKAKYVGDPAEGPKPNVPEEFRAFGVTFERGKSVDVSKLSKVQREKLIGNSHFEVTGAAKEAAQAAAEPELPATPEASAPRQDDPTQAGRGR